MAFEVVERGRFTAATPLLPGQCALNKAGGALFRASDLGKCRIGARATVLIDPGTLRLGIRPPRGDELNIAMSVCPVKAKDGVDTGRRQMTLTRAIRRLGLTPEAAAGRHALEFKEDMVIVNLIKAEPEKGKKK